MSGLHLQQLNSMNSFPLDTRRMQVEDMQYILE